MLSVLQQKNLGTTGPWLALGLALVMMVTRVGHFGEAGGPPDASWAVFLLAGLWLQDARAFPAFFSLGWLADMVAFSLGTPTDCYSLAYLFLIPAYGSLWAAGQLLGRHAVLSGPQGAGMLGAAALLSGVVCFFWANLGMWWLAETATPYSLVAYLGAVSQYLPSYLLTMGTYVAMAFVLALAVASRKRAALGAKR